MTGTETHLTRPRNLFIETDPPLNRTDDNLDELPACSTGGPHKR